MLQRISVVIVGIPLILGLVIRALFEFLFQTVFRISKSFSIFLLPKVLFKLGRTTGPFNDGQIWSRLGYLYERSGDLEKSMRCFEKARNLSPSDGYCYWDLGCLYEKQQRAELAIENYEMALQIGNDFTGDFRRELLGKIQELKFKN